MCAATARFLTQLSHCVTVLQSFVASAETGALAQHVLLLLLYNLCLCLQVSSSGNAGTPYYQLAAAHARAAADAAAGAPAQHAAALLAAGLALMQQAHAAMLEEAAVQQRRQHCQMLASAGAAADVPLLQPSFDADAFWAPWPAQRPQLLLVQHTGTTPAATDIVSRTSSDAQPEGATQQEAADSDTAVADSSDASPSPAASAVPQGLLADSSSGAAPVEAAAAALPMPEPAAKAHQEAVQLLQQALSEALSCQQWATARTAALALVRCHGLLQPQQAAVCLALAQDCKSVADMKAVFERWAPGCTAQQPASQRRSMCS
jgi:hypothetical protein